MRYRILRAGRNGRRLFVSGLLSAVRPAGQFSFTTGGGYKLT